MIKREEINIEKTTKLIPFHVAEARGVNSQEIIHFFVSDKKLNSIKNRKFIPEIYKNAKAVLTPDFSLYLDDDESTWRKNIELNRKIGEWWQKEGIIVIPTISWADEKSFEFCFEGIATGCTVAISSQGIHFPEIFYNGLDEMIKRLSPSQIISYGTNFYIDFDNVYYFSTFSEEKLRKYGRAWQV